MVSVGFALELLLTVLIIYKLLNLVRYVYAARKVGLPYVVTPILETEVIGLVFTPVLRWIYHEYLLTGKGWPRWCRFMIKDWQWEDKRRAHDEYGDVFLVVAPEGIICYSADAAMGYDVMNRREFIKPRDKMSKPTRPCFEAGDCSNGWQNCLSHTVRALELPKAKPTSSMFESPLLLSAMRLVQTTWSGERPFFKPACSFRHGTNEHRQISNGISLP